MPELPAPFFGGFLPKKVARIPAWLKNPVVEEICSISECISKAPPGRIDHWKHNDLTLYDTLEAAQTVIPAGEVAEYDIFGFRVFPVCFDSQGMKVEEALVGKVNAPATKLDGWEFLGYDLAGRSTGYGFECSPLSCNHCAENTPVNRHCLLDDLHLAVQKGSEFGNPQSGVEPGPYYLVEVFRKSAEAPG